MIKAASTVGGLTMVSRILGFVRDVMMASILGAGLVADAFLIAFKLPNFFRRLFAEGAFNNAFVPMFSRMLAGDPEAAREFARQVQSTLATIVLVIVILGEIFMPWLLYVFAPGFADDPEKYALTVDLARMTFPYLFFISLVSLYGGVMNGIGRFAAPAATPVLLNMCLISAMALAWLLLTYAPDAIGLEMMAGEMLAWGVSAAGLAQLLWLMHWAKQAGWGLSLRWPKMTKDVRRLIILILPVLVGVGVAQINTLVDMILATSLGEGAVSWLYYADRLNQLPVGVVGIALGVVLLPLLAQKLAEQNIDAAMDAQNRAVEFSLFLTIPAAAGLMAAAFPIITTLFERGSFHANDSLQTAPTLLAYASGLPAYVLVKVLGPGFYAREDTVTPVKIAAFAMIANIILNLILMQFFAHIGLAMATAISSWMNAILMAVILSKRAHFQPDARLKKTLALICVNAIVMAAIVWYLADQVLVDWWARGELWRIPGVAMTIGAGAAAYAILSVVTGAMPLARLKRLVKR